MRSRAPPGLSKVGLPQTQEHDGGMPPRISAVFCLRQQAKQDRTDAATAPFPIYGWNERHWKRLERKLRG